jgi:hypothetical protein
LIAEGTPATWQAERTGFGLPSNFSLFTAAVQPHRPDIHCTPLNIADGEGLPFGASLSDFDGVMIPGSPLHIYDPDACVSTTAGFERKFFVSNGIAGLAADGGGASATRRTRPRAQAAGPRPDARAGDAVRAR